MSKQYQPRLPFNLAAKHLKRSDKPDKINGANQYTYTEAKEPFYWSAVSYGGTETQVNGVTVIEDTWQIDAFYNPNFRKGDKVIFLDDGREYEVLASPENINRRGQYMRFKVRAIGG